MKLLQGDCRKLVLEAAEEGSVDAIITDPPYELGIAGQPWDKTGVAHDPETWDAFSTLLKPGGYVLAFGATRNHHRLAAALELAGYTIQDEIPWLYACLTPDVEVLTETGWRSGIDITAGERIAQYDPETEAITLAAVEQTHRFLYYGPMRVLRNHDTDQLLTPNHRVIFESKRRVMRGGVRRSWWENRWAIQEADQVPRSGCVRLPLAGYAQGKGTGGEDYASLLGWVWTEGSFDRTGSGVRVYQSPSANPEKTRSIQQLLDRIAPGHRRYDRERPPGGHRVAAAAEATWYISGSLARRVRADLPEKRPTTELLWRMTLAERRALMDAALAGDGSRDSRHGSQQFYAKHRTDLELFQTALSLTGQRGRIKMRSDREAGVLSVTPRPTTELQTAKLRRPDEHYAGDVWCVTVPTGAFLARRDGLIFITGNSGYPKREGLLKPANEPIVVARNGGNPSLDTDTAVEGRWPANAAVDEHVAAWLADQGAPPFAYVAKPSPGERRLGAAGAYHETVKPLKLMRWLVRLCSREGDRIFDPFMGSGTTIAAALIEKRDAVGVELNAGHFAHARIRVADLVAPYGITLPREETSHA